MELGQAARAAYYFAIDGWVHDHQWGTCAPSEREAWIEAARGVLRSQRAEAGVPEVKPQGAPSNCPTCFCLYGFDCRDPWHSR